MNSDRLLRILIVVFLILFGAWVYYDNFVSLSPLGKNSESFSCYCPIKVGDTSTGLNGEFKVIALIQMSVIAIASHVRFVIVMQ